MKYIMMALLSGIFLLSACKDEKAKTKKNVAEDYSNNEGTGVDNKNSGQKPDRESRSMNTGYDISAPGGWSKSDTTIMGQRMVFVRSARENEGDMFLENVNVISEKIGNMDMDDYIDLSTSNIKKGLSQVEILKSSDKNFNGIDFRCVRYSHVYNGVPVDVDVYFTLDNSTAYIITCSAEGGTISKWEPKFEEIVRSFQL